MIIYSLFAATIIAALLSFLLIWRGNKGWSTLLPISLAAFIYLYGAWVFASVYVKYVFAVVFLALLVAALTRGAIAKPQSKAKRVINVSLSAILLALCAFYYTGMAGTPYGAINLSLPFKSGTYFVFQGGRGLPTNVFHYAGRHTLFAMDIIKLNGRGGRGERIFSEQLQDYEIFNDTIYSPCNGNVIKEEHSFADNIPPHRSHTINGVLIETDSAYIYLGHMRQNGTLVRVGDRVVTGQPVGLAGNSGMSIEPHLHIQAHAKTFTGLPFYKEPQLLILFNGKEYRLFESIKAANN